jgi:cell division septation protein DedD
MVDEPEGVSSRQLLAAFFAVVLLCAVFFSLGFFLGHKERSPESSLAVEQVPSSSSDAPSAVNLPEQRVPSDASSGSATGAAKDQGVAAGAPPANASSGSSAESARAETPAAAAALHEEPANRKVTQPTSAQPNTAQPVALQTTAAAPPGRVPPGSLIQVAALTNQQDANDMVGVLQSRGYPALILTPQQTHAKDNLFRVVAGPYQTRAEAGKARDRLAAAGFKPFIRP